MASTDSHGRAEHGDAYRPCDMTAASDAAAAADLDDHLDLGHGLRVRVRALRRNEEAPIRALDRQLSVRTRHLRFFTPFQSIPDNLVRRLASVDSCRNIAVVAEHDGREDTPIALASFCAVTDDMAEVALVVRDDYQRRGVGTALCGFLLSAAERRGFHRFTASMTIDNVAIRRMLNRFGHVLESTTRRGVREVVFICPGSSRSGASQAARR